MTDQTEHPPEQADAEWFRESTPREHRIAAALFVGYGLFFIALFVVLKGWWFRWVILFLGGYSILHGLGHLREIQTQRTQRAQSTQRINPN